MKFMMLVIPGGYEQAEPGTMPEAEHVAEMMKFNKALEAAGVLLSLEGLHPPSMGARVTYKNRKPSVIDGPHIETKEVLGGFWMIDVESKEAAIQWAKRCPMDDNEIIEIRQVQAFDDFPEDVQEAASGFREIQENAEKTSSQGATNE